jgi:hypothetical protein
MDKDFWVLMTGLTNQLDHPGSTPEERHEQLIMSFRRLSSPTKAAMLRKMQFVSSMLIEVLTLADRECQGPSQ